MSVNVVRYRDDVSVRWGVVEGSSIVPLAVDDQSTNEFVSRSARAVLDGGHRAEGAVPIEHVELLAPVTSDRQFLCQAVNYRTHMRESGFNPATNPFNVFFQKASSSLAAADGDIVCPDHVEFLDYEVEIGLVLARDVSGPMSVGPNGLADHVVGLVAVNDVSARDLQLAETQFYRAKSYRTFGPVGPYLTLVDGDDLARFAELRLRLWVNDEARQDSYAADMVHGPAESLTELSSVQDWHAGDLLATGTPGGCALRAPAFPVRAAALAMSPKRRHALVQRSAARNPRRLRPGDVVELHIGTDDGAIDLGRQRSTVVGGTA